MTVQSTLAGLNTKTIFYLGIIITATGAVSPPLALAAGLCFGLLLTHPYPKESKDLSKLLLQYSVVGLGFGMNLGQVLKVGASGVIYTAISILGSLTLGWMIGRMLLVKKKAAYLITVGTAICGGSAIAAIAPVIDASEEEISVAMATVFVLNSVALFVFPWVGLRLHLSQTQFGLWAALAIHDTSSVVGASAKYGAQALAIGTTVKLARALWIVPVTLASAAYFHAHSRRNDPTAVKAKIKLPWFILFFCLASVLRTYTSNVDGLYDELTRMGRMGLTVTLFLIGTGLSRRTLQQVGARPFLQGIILWLIVASVSLYAIFHSYIRL
jgi:uncharacterized integral membrane protein (TIGR00698 family)